MYDHENTTTESRPPTDPFEASFGKEIPSTNRHLTVTYNSNTAAHGESMTATRRIPFKMRLRFYSTPCPDPPFPCPPPPKPKKKLLAVVVIDYGRVVSARLGSAGALTNQRTARAT